jgi:pyruvate dehydrogenase E2 component (dihydrolipoamide acetyltransferase)
VSIEIIPVPDLGGADKVDVIEVCVQPGQMIEVEDSLVVLESDKASMEIPSPKAGKVISVKVKEGDALSEGDAILELEIADDETTSTAAATDSADQPADHQQSEAKPQPEKDKQSAGDQSSSNAQSSSNTQSASSDKAAGATTTEELVRVPDLGGSSSVDVIEISVAVGDEVAEGDSLLVLESDKASMEIPSPLAGKVLEIRLKEGDKASEGDDMVLLQVSAAPAVADEPDGKDSPATQAKQPQSASAAKSSTEPPASSQLGTISTSQADSPAPEYVATPMATPSGESISSGGSVYAGPSVRKLARQLGVDLTKLKPSGPRGRFSSDDVRAYVKQLIDDVNTGKVAGGTGIPAVPPVDFAQFGEIETVKMSKIAKLTAQNMSRSWLNVPHVTQFDEADITEMEAFRNDMKAEAEKRGVKLTPLPFLLKAAAAALEAEPSFNVSLHSDGEHLVKKNYIHIGVAVDTPAGLMVPVIRDVNKKGLWELAAETAELAAKARAGKLTVREMQGGCFTISSLGSIGGNGFTPIVNAPEVAIMGVSKAQIKPVWDGSEFVPRNLLPLSVSYDHRAINGADCGRFFTYMVSVLSDIRKLLL